MIEKINLKSIEEVDFNGVPVHAAFWYFCQTNAMGYNPSPTHFTNIHIPHSLYKSINCFFELNKECHANSLKPEFKIL